MSRSAKSKLKNQPIATATSTAAHTIAVTKRCRTRATLKYRPLLSPTIHVVSTFSFISQQLNNP